ncbi:hypothetical protein BDZ91DRAFT_793878 [Kalaharituber pfeilii]|nr:hypothetical protein BDZ91DRAFT_793878 [Kalaharituber pfeilii]
MSTPLVNSKSCLISLDGDSTDSTSSDDVTSASHATLLVNPSHNGDNPSSSSAVPSAPPSRIPLLPPEVTSASHATLLVNPSHNGGNPSSSSAVPSAPPSRIPLLPPERIILLTLIFLRTYYPNLYNLYYSGTTEEDELQYYYNSDTTEEDGLQDYYNLDTTEEDEPQSKKQRNVEDERPIVQRQHGGEPQSEGKQKVEDEGPIAKRLRSARNQKPKQGGGEATWSGQR